jgi:hypothetical protein
MVSEFDLPCAECQHELVREEVTDREGRPLTVASCPDCDSHYYPEDALGRQ